MLFFRKKPASIDYRNLISELEVGDNSKLKQRLAFHKTVEYLDGVDWMLAKMKRPDGDSRNLSLLRSLPKGQFELAIFNVPWNPGDLPYLPLILERGSGIIYGIMLPFNEITPLLSKRQQKDIGALVISWTGFAMESGFGINLSI